MKQKTKLEERIINKLEITGKAIIPISGKDNNYDVYGEYVIEKKGDNDFTAHCKLKSCVTDKDFLSEEDNLVTLSNFREVMKDYSDVVECLHNN